jgi:hypothetical protein
VSSLAGVSRVLRGESVTNLLGNERLSGDEEKNLILRYTLRALQILRMELERKKVFTLSEGGEH